MMKARELCKRSLAILLVPCMVVALLPAMAFAIANPDESSSDTNTEASNGDTGTAAVATASLSTLADGSDGDGGGTPPDSNANRNVEVTVTVEAPAGLLESVRIDGYDVANNKVMVENKTTRTVGICIAFGKAVSKVEINGRVFNENEIPADHEGWINFTGIADASSYTIKLSEGVSEDITVVWDYTGAFGPDAQVKNGKVDLVSIKRNGTVIYPGNNDGMAPSINAEGGWVALKRGDDVTLRLIPNYGYQLASVSANELALTPQSQVSTFELRNLQGNIHFSSIFEKSENIITTESEFVKGASIANGENAASSGNLSLTVADAPDYSVDVSGALEDPNAEKVTSLDLTLENVVSKGNGSDWTTNITEFPDPITVSMDVPDELAEGQTYGVVRDHNGQLTELPCTYANGVLSFETNMFSTYTIVKQAVKSGENSSKKSPKTGVDSTPLTAATLVFGLIALGTGIYLMRTRRDE